MTLPEAMVGRTLGRCRIERLLGVGGMGAVYQATHEALQIPVAVKLLGGPSTDGTLGPDMAERFLREAQLAASLRHPNIVRVLDANIDQGDHFIIMELLPGVSLASLLRQRGALSVEETRHLGRQVADALAHAHARGIIHRDIKPDNVMVAPDGTAVLTDFGIASMVMSQNRRLTRQGSVVGTPWYLAPEQARGDSNVDARADVYALGVMLYELLTGLLPFDAEDAMQQMVARLTTDPVPLSRRRGDLPAPLVALVGRMLAREPEQRVQTAAEVATHLAPVPVGVPEPQHGATREPTTVTDAAAVRAGEVHQRVNAVGLPLPPPDPTKALDLKVADVKAMLRLAEDLSAGSAHLHGLYRAGEADLVLFTDRQPALVLRVTRGAPSRVTLREAMAAAMVRGEGLVAVQPLEAEAVVALRAWLDGARVLGPLPAELLRPLGLFMRLQRNRLSGVLSVMDRNMTSLALFRQGALGGLFIAPGHRGEFVTETLGGLGAWIENCTPEGQVSFQLLPGEAPSAARVVPEELLRAALAVTSDAVGALAEDARKEFGLASAQVFSAALRDATARVRDLVPQAAFGAGGGARALDVQPLWEQLQRGSVAGRDVLTAMALEALCAGALRAAGETLPPRRLAKARAAFLAALLKRRDALDAVGVTDALQRLAGG
ncbi:MAG: serine/threonine protein kinase [Deltaproteobacteria bacterium]|nr:serine/threonine protein kinase [Deltaproteobacteria bacterium]